MRTNKRSAFTLMEVLVVMTIFVILAAVGVPLAQTMLIDARMTAAGDLVRARMADARSYALDQGRPWRLGFIPNTGKFQLAPDDSPEWDNVNQDATEEVDLIRGELPRDIIFGVEQGDVLGPNGSPAAGAKWETMGVYQWDGSARDDVTTYFGKGGLIPMRVNLRGLTGGVSIELPVVVKGETP
jgi:prepilin-type N-terminal cleavage/methylation domain-containing protein